MRTYAVDNGYCANLTYEDLQRLCERFDSLPEEERLEYQQDSPYAEYITGLNTDTYADESIRIATRIWDYYADECAEEERETDWEEYLDRVENDWDWDACHTWLRVTNIHNESNEEIDAFGRECMSDTMKALCEQV